MSEAVSEPTYEYRVVDDTHGIPLSGRYNPLRCSGPLHRGGVVSGKDKLGQMLGFAVFALLFGWITLVALMAVGVISP